MKNLSYAVTLLGISVLGTGLVACSGGSSAGSGRAVIGVATPTAVPVSSSVPVPAVATTIPIASVNGVSASANVPAPSTPVTITSTVSVGPPAGVPALTTAPGGSGKFVVLQTQNYDSFTPSNPVTWGPGATLSYTLPAGVSTSGNWWIATYDSATSPTNGYYYATLGPGVANGQTLTFSSPTGFAFGARQYIFVVYQSQ